jgi:hypothetical protein
MCGARHVCDSILHCRRNSGIPLAEKQCPLVACHRSHKKATTLHMRKQPWNHEKARVSTCVGASVWAHLQIPLWHEDSGPICGQEDGLDDCRETGCDDLGERERGVMIVDDDIPLRL